MNFPTIPVAGRRGYRREETRGGTQQKLCAPHGSVRPRTFGGEVRNLDVAHWVEVVNWDDANTRKDRVESTHGVF